MIDIRSVTRMDRPMSPSGPIPYGSGPAYPLARIDTPDTPQPVPAGAGARLKLPGTRPRRAWKATYLEALGRTANVRYACLKAGVGRKTAYRHRDQDPAFRAAWADALEDACDRLELVARQRALKGLSDNLLMFLLKAHRPGVYREAKRNVNMFESMSDEDLIAWFKASFVNPEGPR
jgi:hypothetical protein